MSTLSTGAKTSVGYIVESTYGTTPATPSLLQVPFSSINVATSKEELLDSRIDGTRQIKEAKHGNKTVTVELSGDFSFADYDDFIASAMLNTFSTSVTVGDVISSMTMEEAQLDISKYRKIQGAVVNTMSIEAPIDGNATITFGINAKEEGYILSGSTANTSLDADGYTAAAQNTPFTHVSGTMTGASDEGNTGDLVGLVQGITLELDNGYEPAFVWAQDTAECQIFKKANITGSLTLYYTDEVIVNKFLNGVESQLSFSLTDGTNTYTFDMGKILYNGADMAVSDDGVRTVTLPFRALDAGADTMLKITKS